MDTTALKRLSIKTDQQTLIIQRDYRLSPVESKVLFTRLQEYLSEHQHDYLADGQIIYPAVAFSEPAGRPLEQCQLVRVRLTLDAPEDLDALKVGGTPLLRRLRLFRMSFEAVDQAGRLTQEDFTRLLGVDRSTVQRIIASYRQEGVFIPTRGQSKDIGPGTSHKSYVVEMFLNFATFSEISRKLGEKISSFKRYIRDFTSVLCAYDLALPLEKIRVITGLSPKLVREYIQLIERFDCPEYQTILQRLREPLIVVEKKGVSN
jgi:hypothetical protein